MSTVMYRMSMFPPEITESVKIETTVTTVEMAMRLVCQDAIDNIAATMLYVLLKQQLKLFFRCTTAWAYVNMCWKLTVWE